MAKKKDGCLKTLLLSIVGAAFVVCGFSFAMWAAHNWVEHVRVYGLAVRK